jgi:hypothetical protein
MSNDSYMNVSSTPSTPSYIIFSGFPLTPASSMVWIPENHLLNTSQPMVSSQHMRTNPFVFPGGSLDHRTWSIPWASNPIFFGMLDMISHVSSSVLTSNVNPSSHFGGMTPPYVSFSFGWGNIPQPTPMVGRWNPPSYGTNPSFNILGWSAQMGSQFNSYIPSIIPSSSTSIPIKYFIMVNLPLTSSVSLGGSQFYSVGNPQHGFPSSRGNTYNHHMNNPYHVSFSSQVASKGMVLLQNFMNQLGG